MRLTRRTLLGCPRANRAEECAYMLGNGWKSFYRAPVEQLVDPETGAAAFLPG